MSEEHGPLPRYDFVGLHRGPELQEAATNYLETRQVQLPPELQKSPELQGQLAAMNESIIEYGASLGLDLTHRATPLERVHLLDEHGMEEFYRMFPNQRGSLGAMLTSGDLVVKQLLPDLKRGFLHNSNHELVHGSGIKDQLLTPASSGWDVTEIRGGFNFTDGSFHGWDEYYTEKINRRVISGYWPNHPELRELTEPQATVPEGTNPDLMYDTLLHFGAKLDQIIASQAGSDILIAMERSYFTGDSQVFRTLGDSFGNDFVRNLGALKTHLPADVSRTASQLGIQM